MSVAIRKRMVDVLRWTANVGALWSHLLASIRSLTVMIGDPNSREQQLTTITTSKGDTTATGIYVLETIGSYSGLRQSITTTVGSSTSTAPDGSIKTEAAIAVIFAGGAFFYLNGTHSLFSQR